MVAVTRVAAISVDLDALRYYRSIHGLDSAETKGAAPDPVLDLAIRRLSDWATELEIPLTWFVVGSDLCNEQYCDSLLGLCRRGHELGNHSFDHYYDLTRRSRSVMREQISLCAEQLSRITGKAKHGFRAPGYTMTDELASLLTELGVVYDSSVFPCPAYYAAKAAALFGQRLIGRSSHSILDAPRVLTAPTRPYRMGERYERPGQGILELPIQVTPRLRLPYIGTSLTLVGPIGARVLTAQLVGEPFVNLELHGIDALDAGDGVADLARVQPDLRIGWQLKLKRLAAVVHQLKAADFRFVMLQDAASRNQ